MSNACAIRLHDVACGRERPDRRAPIAGAILERANFCDGPTALLSRLLRIQNAHQSANTVHEHRFEIDDTSLVDRAAKMARGARHRPEILEPHRELMVELAGVAGLEESLGRREVELRHHGRVHLEQNERACVGKHAPLGFRDLGAGCGEARERRQAHEFRPGQAALARLMRRSDADLDRLIDVTAVRKERHDVRLHTQPQAVIVEAVGPVRGLLPASERSLVVSGLAVANASFEKREGFVPLRQALRERGCESAPIMPGVDLRAGTLDREFPGTLEGLARRGEPPRAQVNSRLELEIGGEIGNARRGHVLAGLADQRQRRSLCAHLEQGLGGHVQAASEFDSLQTRGAQPLDLCSEFLGCRPIFPEPNQFVRPLAQKLGTACGVRIERRGAFVMLARFLEIQYFVEGIAQRFVGERQECGVVTRRGRRQCLAIRGDGGGIIAEFARRCAAVLERLGELRDAPRGGG